MAAALPFHELAFRIGPLGLRPFEALLLLAVLTAAPTLVLGAGGWLEPRLVDREVLLIVALGALAVALHPGPGESTRAFRLVILEPALFYFLATRLLPGRDGRLWLAVALVLGAAAAAVVGLGQLVTGVGTIEAEGVTRIRAAYPSPNNLALYLDRIVPLAVALALAGTAGWRTGSGQPVRTPSVMLSEAKHPYGGGDGSFAPLRMGWVLAVAASLLVVGQALTFSVGGWIATVLGMVTVTVLARRWRVLAAMAVAAGIAAPGLLAWRPERVFSHLDAGAASTSDLRVMLWRSALEMLWDRPFTGIGLDNFLYLYNPARGGSYMFAAAWREPDLSHPHNLLLDWWLSLGVIGAIVLVRLLIAFWRRARHAWRETQSQPLDRAIVVGAIGGFVATVAHGLTDNSYFLPDLAMLWWASFTLLGTGRCRPAAAGAA